MYGQAHKDASSNALSTSMMRMLRDRARQTQIQCTQIPFIHPHLKPYGYLEPINGMPVSTTSATVHLDTEQAGLALPLLMVTREEVKLQTPGATRERLWLSGLHHTKSAAGLLLQGHRSLATKEQCLLQTPHYHLARQLATLQNATLKLTLALGMTGLRETSLVRLLVQIRIAQVTRVCGPEPGLQSASRDLEAPIKHCE